MTGAPTLRRRGRSGRGSGPGRGLGPEPRQGPGLGADGQDRPDARRFAAFVAAGLVALAGCSATGGGDREASTAPGTMGGDGAASSSGSGSQLVAGPSSTTIDWARCGNGYECADVLLPLDQADPDGEQVRIALKRLPAASGDAEGAILLNPGGPGESGVALVTSAPDILGAEVLARYDVIGFDPRGVGASTHVRCLEPGEEDPTGVGFDLSDPRDVARMRDAVTALAASCRERSGALLDHVGTTDVVADLERIRELLGFERLDYLGYSYGTLIGALYADTYPERVGRMVLDGVVDPSIDYSRLQDEQTTAFDEAFSRFVAECRRGRTCPLDADPDEAARDVLDLADELDAAADQGRSGVDGADLVEAMSEAMYMPWAWPEVALGLGDLARGGGGEELFEAVGVGGGGDGGGGDGSGEIEDQASDAVGNDPDVTTDLNYPFWFTAVDCADYPPTGTFEEAVEHARELGERSELFGGSIGEAMCTLWPTAKRREPALVHARGAAPILIIGTVHDPATPYSWAVSLAEQLDSGYLLTYDGDGHGIVGGVSRCVDAVVNEYFLTGELPSAPAVCE